MRRSVTTVLFASVAIAAMGFLVGCEDGPNQTYSPATGTLFNNGETDASVNPGQYPYDAGYAGTNSLQVCTQDLERARWAKMLTEDIKPPRYYAGVDMAGGDSWAGITVEEATQKPDPTTLEGGNCQGTSTGISPCPSGNGECGQIYWGNNQEVIFTYNLATHVVDQMELNLGYTGTMSFSEPANRSLDGMKHDYVLQVGLPPLKDQKTYEIPWDNTNCVAPPKGQYPANPCYDQVLTELYNAAMNTFAAAAGTPFPQDSPSCGPNGDHNCLEYANDGAGDTIFGFRPLVVYFLGSQHSGLPQPVVSTFTTVYNFYSKLEPYSKAPELIKIDPQGPVAAMPVGDNGKTCTQTIGMTYQDFLDNCINVWSSGNQQFNTLDLNKLLGGMQHDYENITFNVVGVNQNFSLTPDLSTYQVVQDYNPSAGCSPDTCPHPTDVSTDWYFDVRASADLTNEGGLLIGTGLVEREFARLAQQDINALTGGTHQIGDPACIPVSAAGAPLGGNVPPGGQYAAGCTGLESMLFAGGACDVAGANAGTCGGAGQPPCCSNYPDDPHGLLVDPFGVNSSVIEPGDPTSGFADLQGYIRSGPFWDTTLQQVVDVLGHGNILGLPAQLRDRRYFFRWFGIANIKYMKAFGACVDANPSNPTSCLTSITPTAIANQPIDMESLFFDNNYQNQFDKFEYIDRSLVQNPPPANQPYLGIPMDYEYGSDVKAANQRYTNWYRRLDREENAMYTAFNVNKKDQPGQENFLNLTNMFGSPVLTALAPSYECAAAHVTGGAYDATDPNFPGMNPAKDCGNPPAALLDPVTGNSLMDLNGQMAAEDPGHAAAYPNAHTLAYYYPGVWGNTVFSKGHSAIRVTEGDRLVEGAHVVLPNFANPWAATSNPNDPNATPINVLVPWAPDQPGSGFSFPYDSTTDKTIQAGELHFEGVLETYTLFYKPWEDIAKQNCYSDNTCNTGYTCQAGQCVASDQTVKIAAIYASDFLGEIFACQDPLTGDVLRVRMYTSTYNVLDWLANHPGDPNPSSSTVSVPSAQDSCSIIVRWSPYDNYPDIVASLTNGVWMNSNSGQGYGRIVDAMLFDTNYENQ